MKKREEFEGAEAAFPNAILCGDDWSWKDAGGDYPVRRFAQGIAEKRQATIFASRATFVVAEPGHGLMFDNSLCN